jgi:hypothetical protein
MKLVKIILKHNINNFFYSSSTHFYFFRQGMESKTELAVGLLNCVKERLKLFHWDPSNFRKN